MGPFPRACQPERYCTAGTHGTENTKSYRANGAVQLPAQRPPKSRGWGIFHLFISLFFFTPLVKHQLEPVFHFLCSFEAFVRVSCFSTSPAKDGRVWPRAAAATGGETIWMRATQNGRGTDGGSAAQRSRCASATQLDGPVPLFFFFFLNPQSAFISAGGGRQRGDGGTKYNIGFNATSPEGLFHIYMTLRKPIENVQKRGRPRDLDKPPVCHIQPDF